MAVATPYSVDAVIFTLPEGFQWVCMLCVFVS